MTEKDLKNTSILEIAKQKYFEDIIDKGSSLNIAAYWDKSKYLIGEYIISQLINGNIKTYDELSNAILKACYKKDKEALKINLNEFYIENEQEVVTKFLKEKVLMFADLNHYNKATNKFFSALADDAVLRMGMKFGNCICRDAYATLGSHVKLRDIKTHSFSFNDLLTHAISKNGFKISKNNINFLETTKQFDETVCEDAQVSLLKTYFDMQKRYIEKANHLNNLQDLESFVTYWKVVKKAFENIENRLTEKSKKFVYSSPVSIQPGWSFEEIKRKKDYFFDKILNQVEKNYFKQQQEQLYNDALLESCKELRSADQKSEYLKNFLHRLDLFNKSLETEKGKNSLANYYLFMKEAPLIISLAYRQLREKSKMLSNDEKEVLNKGIDNIRGIFGTNIGVAEYCFDLSDLLASYKRSVRKNLNGVVTLDTSTEEKFQEFIEKIEKTLIKHNLPYTKQCIKVVVSSISRGFEPIDEQAVEQSKELDFSLPKGFTRKTKRAPKEKI